MEIIKTSVGNALVVLNEYDCKFCRNDDGEFDKDIAAHVVEKMLLRRDVFSDLSFEIYKGAKSCLIFVFNTYESIRKIYSFNRLNDAASAASLIESKTRADLYYMQGKYYISMSSNESACFTMLEFSSSVENPEEFFNLMGEYGKLIAEGDAIKVLKSILV